MQRARLRELFLWTILVVAVYETANHFFRVWTWSLEHLLAFSSSIEFLIVLLVGYCTGTILVAVLAHTLFRYRFSFIDNITEHKTIPW